MTDHAELLQLTPLHSRHRALGALMAPFGGWDMPIQYEGIIAEHRWCREQAALFDICHMGEFLFVGDIVAGGLEDLFTFSVTAIPVGRSKYGFLLNEQGGIIDDLIVFRLGLNEAMIVVNAATAPNDFNVIQSRLRGGQFTDISSITAKLDLQGPRSREVLVDLLGGWVAEIPYFRFVRQTVLGSPAIVSRTGYTGELGYEIFLPTDTVGELWDRLLADPRVKAAGLGARECAAPGSGLVPSTAAILMSRPRHWRLILRHLSRWTRSLWARRRCCNSNSMRWGGSRLPSR